MIDNVVFHNDITQPPALMEIVKTILQPMSNVTKPQCKFMQARLPLLMCLRGRANFRNLSRYSDYHEKTFSRWYRSDFDFVEFKRLSLQPISEAETTLIAATDCSFISKTAWMQTPLRWQSQIWRFKPLWNGRRTGRIANFYRPRQLRTLPTRFTHCLSG